MPDNSNEKKSGKLLKSTQFKFQSKIKSFRERASSSIPAEELAKPGRELHRPMPTSPTPTPKPEDVIYPDKGAESASPGVQTSDDQLSSPQASSLVGGVVGLDDGSSPPDTIGVYDTSALFVMTNQLVWGYPPDDVGNAVQMTLTGFFTSDVPNGPDSADAFDPYVVHDPLSSQFVAVALNSSGTKEPGIFLGSTQDGSLMGNWQYVWISCDSLGLPSGQWFDYPRVGTSDEFVTITVNVYDANNSYVGTNVLVIDKSSYYSDGDVSLSLFDAGPSGTIVPARTYDSGSDHYLVSNGVSNDGNGNCTVSIYAVVGPFDSVEINGPTNIAAPLTYQPGGGAIAPQLDSTNLLDVDDNRMHSAVVRNNSLWCCHTIFLPVTGTVAVSGVQVYELDPGMQTLTQAARYYDPDYASFYAYPSIAVNSIGDVLVGMALFNANEYPQGTYTSRAADDPPNTLRLIGTTVAGLSAWTLNQRWGDYSGTIVDPTDDLSFWTLQETCLGDSQWGTQWIQVPQITGS